MFTLDYQHLFKHYKYYNAFFPIFSIIIPWLNISFYRNVSHTHIYLFMYDLYFVVDHFLFMGSTSKVSWIPLTIRAYSINNLL